MDNNKLVQFLSAIFHPNQYPLSKRNIVKIQKKLIPTRKDRRVFNKNIVFINDYYYIKNINNLLKPQKVVKYLIETNITKISKPKYIWGFCIKYYDSKDRMLFEKSILQEVNTKNKTNRFTKIAIQEINNLKNIGQFPEYFEIENIKDNFKSYYWNMQSIREFNRFINPTLLLMLENLKIINNKNWSKNILGIKNPILKSVINSYYMFDIQKYKYDVCSKITTNDVSLISLSIINLLYFINFKLNDTQTIRKYLRYILENLKQLNYKRFYWYGVILSNSEYLVREPEKIKIIEKIVKQYIVKDLIAYSYKKKAVQEYKNGLEETPRNTSYRHMDILKSVDKDNKNLSLELMLEVVNNYKKIIPLERTHIVLVNVFGEDESDSKIYTNVLVYSICHLVLNNKIFITKLANSLFKNFHLSEEDYLYNSSKMISEKDRVLHVFYVLLSALDALKKNNYAIDSKVINSLFEKFLTYINIHLWHEDEILLNTMDYIFELDICNENDMLYKEINILANRAIPPFKALAILIKKVPEDPKIKDISSFIKDYFDERYKYFSSEFEFYRRRQFEFWHSIFQILEDSTRSDICLKAIKNHK